MANWSSVLTLKYYALLASNDKKICCYLIDSCFLSNCFL